MASWDDSNNYIQSRSYPLPIRSGRLINTADKKLTLEHLDEVQAVFLTVHIPRRQNSAGGVDESAIWRVTTGTSGNGR